MLFPTATVLGRSIPSVREYPEWVGRRVWCYGAQSYRPFGTAPEYTAVPLRQVVPMPEGVAIEQGACLGIPGMTAHRAVNVAGSVEERTVLVQGGADAERFPLNEIARAHEFVEHPTKAGHTIVMI